MAELRRIGSRPAIDYYAREFDSILASMRSQAAGRLPEWTDRDSEADVGTVLLELFAHMGDILSYYQDRIANESFLTTARTRRSVIDHLRLIGYELGTAAPASARLTIAVPERTRKVTINRGDAFATSSEDTAPSIRFEYDGEPQKVSTFELDEKGRRTFGLDVVEGRYVDKELLGESDFTPNQRFRLPHAPLILRSRIPSPEGEAELVVTTSDQPDPWTQRETLAFSHAVKGAQGKVLPPRDYVVEIDENDQATVIFGDGQLGAIPPKDAEIRASYRVGGGAAGNVPADAIKSVLTGELARIGASVTGHGRATGGSDRETIESAVRQAPAVFRSLRRAVTAADYEALALERPGVAKVRAQATNWNTVVLHVAPDGGGSVSDSDRFGLRRYFEDKRPLSTLVEVVGPTYRPVGVTVTVGVLPYYARADTQAQVEVAAGALLAFENVDFGRPLYLSRFYEVIEAIDAVEFANVTEFRLDPDPENLEDMVASDGILELEQYEMPAPTDAAGYVGGVRVIATGGF
jgi:hypothetical protein